MATRALHRDDDHDDRDEQKKSEPKNLTQIRKPAAMTLDEELDEISVAIDEAWELLEPSFRYLADR